MILVKKIQKNIKKYCSHCDGEAKYELYFTNPVIIQRGSNGAFCEHCMYLLKSAINQITSHNKNVKICNARSNLLNTTP